MSETLLVGVDGSDCCRRAAEAAAAHAKVIGARLIVVYIIEWSPYSFNTPEENELRHKRRAEEIQQAHSKVLDPLISEFKEAGLKVEGLVRHGHVAEVLLQIVDEVHASQIYIGRIGTSRLKSLLFGSVAGTLVQVAPVPVTVVP